MKTFELILMYSLIYLLLLTGCRQIFGDGNQTESIVQAPIEAENIIVQSPVKGSIWNPGDTIGIKWIAPTIKKIDIRLYRKSEYKLTITENLENTGKFDWIIPVEIQLSNHYVVKIISHNNPDAYKFSGRFGIQ